MQIDIRARGFTLTEALRGHVERRLRFTLSRFSDRIDRVVVMLDDVDSPRGGIDRRSQVRIEVAHRSPLVIEDTEADLYMAIDRAADRAGRTLARRLARGKDLTRSSRENTLPPQLSGVD